MRRLAVVLVVLAGCSSPSGPAVGAPSRTASPPAVVVPTPTTKPTPTPTRLVRPTLKPSMRPHDGGPLTGKTIVLDPGHNALNSRYPSRANAPVPAGGFSKPCNTSGTSTNAGYPEHAYTFDVVTRAAALLRAQGARVILTRPNDAGFGPCINERAAIANRNHAALTISVHADGAAASGRGFHVIEPAVAPDGGNRAIVAVSAKLALALRAAFKAATGEPYSTYTGQQGLTKRSDLGGLNLARVPAVFIECGNMRNAGDASRLSSAAFRQRAAAGIDNAVLAFLRG